MKQNACKENEARLSLASLLATLLLLRKSHFCGEQRDYHQVRGFRGTPSFSKDSAFRA